MTTTTLPVAIRAMADRAASSLAMAAVAGARHGYHCAEYRRYRRDCTRQQRAHDRLVNALATDAEDGWAAARPAPAPDAW